jgi:hypothetical protein
MDLIEVLPAQQVYITNTANTTNTTNLILNSGATTYIISDKTLFKGPIRVYTTRVKWGKVGSLVLSGIRYILL